MGNYRFRLSDMMPNAWFYKLKDMGKTRKNHTSHPTKKIPPSTSQKPHISEPRCSHYFTSEPTRADRFHNSPINPKASDTHFPEPSRKSCSKKRAKRKSIYKPSPRLVPSSSVSTGCSCHVSPADSSPEPDSSKSEAYNFAAPESYDIGLDSWSSSCNCHVSSSTTDIIIDMNQESFSRKVEKFDDFDTISGLKLPPILTKPVKFTSSSRLEKMKEHRSLSVKIVKEESIRAQKEHKTNSLIRKSSSTGIKLRPNSPRIGGRKMQASARKSLSSGTCSKSKNSSISESFAIVKTSVDPQRDFKDSMVEMIVENNIRASKDLEILLACYLSLNSSEYHDDIVKAFEQIWFDMTEFRL